MSKHKGNCRDLLASLSEYIDGSLDESLCAEIDRHVADCEDCRIVVDTLRKTVYLYHRTAQDPRIPNEVRERLFHRLDLDPYLDQDAG
ncbi:MAG: zf-HC2 domain-containing protein [Anaerolineales bacterium]|jgi:anti-sigma factor (TIGR02949 family)